VAFSTSLGSSSTHISCEFRQQQRAGRKEHEETIEIIRQIRFKHCY
jgi:hypothetical protein